MPKSASLPDLSTPHGRLQHARSKRGYKTALQFSQTHEIPQSTYANHESGGRAFKRSAAIEYARHLKISLDWLLTGAGSMESKPDLSKLETIPIVGTVQAGVFREALEDDPDEWDAIQLPVDSQFPEARRFALEVGGESMNRLYPDGSIIICVRFFDIGRLPATGEKVVCQRRISVGQVEATVKEFVVESDGNYLWPRSHSPEHQQPFKLLSDEVAEENQDDWGNLFSVVKARQIGRDEIDEFEIYALVIGSYQRENTR